MADDTRARIVAAAAELLAQAGREALTTRAVGELAGVQAPTIYRLFGDKGGLLDAVAEHGFASYLAEKAVRAPDGDPVEDLRRGWDLHVGFGLANPALYALMYGDPRPGVRWRAADSAREILHLHVGRIAAAGRLRVAEGLAAELVHAAGSGTVLSLLALPDDERDPRLSETAREATIAAITTASSPLADPGPAPAAIALRARLPESADLTPGERALLEELLERLAGT